jgi:1,4-dihydroxy-2-naphthoate octaprenyltransferase
MSVLSILCAHNYSCLSQPPGTLTLNYWAFVCVSVAILLFHLATNTISEYRDCVIGVDDVHSPSTKYRLVTGIVPQKHVLYIGITAFIIASILGIIAVIIGQLLLLIPGLIGACISISYSEWPLRLKYKPYGEACVFIAYGPLLFSSCVLALVGSLSLQDVIFSVPPGLITTMILLANNIRDYEYDVGKTMTFVTKFGLEASWKLMLSVIHIAYLLVIAMICCETLPMSTLTVFITYPLVIAALRNKHDPKMVNILGMLHISFLLIIALCLF